VSSAMYEEEDVRSPGSEAPFEEEWLTLRRDAQMAVSKADEQLQQLRDAAMSLSVERRRSRGAGAAEQSGDDVLSSELAAPLPASWDAPSPRAPPVMEEGSRVAVQDLFTVPGSVEAVGVWWEATLVARTGASDFVGRPVCVLAFDDLEIQYRDSEGERCVHAEEGGEHPVTFLNDTVLLDLDSGEELPFRRARFSADAGAMLLGTQIVSL